MQKNINYKMCAECKGACCKQVGCIYMPNDFKNMHFNNLRKLLDKGNISISGQPFPIVNDVT